MNKIKPIKQTDNDDRTKPKLPVKKKVESEKPTLAIRQKAYNDIANKLKCQSAAISEESSAVLESEESEVVEVDKLYVIGTLSNLGDLDEELKKKYGVSHGVKFEVDEYIVILTGRHQINLRNGIPLALYAPSSCKSARDPRTSKITVVIERKSKDNSVDPMLYPYFIVDPQTSLYPTYICSWIECKRKITIDHYIEYNQEANEFMSLGNAIHRYLEWIIRKEVEVKVPEEIEIRRLYESFLYEMFLIDMPFEIFAERIEQGVVNLVEWYEKYIVKGTTIELHKWDKKYLKINRVLGSEVMIKSKYFGLRGKLDGLFEGEFWDEKEKVRYSVTVPFELKTGKKSLDSHKKQIDLYNFLVRENRNMPVVGLLYYSESNTLEYRVENPMICFENVNVHRNKILLNLLDLQTEPEFIKFPSLPQTFDQCRNCSVSLECAVNRLEPEKLKDLEDCETETPEKYNESIIKQIQSLSVLEFSYLKKWTYLLHLEEFEERQLNLDNRQKNFYNHLKVELSELSNFLSYTPGNSLSFTIIKSITSSEMSEELEGYFRSGEKVRIFIPKLKLADGCRIVCTSKTTKKFEMKVEIKNDEIKFNRRTIEFMLETDDMPSLEVEIEKYENSSYNYGRGYCYKFVTKAEPWIKQIVIEESYEETTQTNFDLIEPEMETLNEDQALAFRQCLSMQRFCLVEGMPGTGKTELIIRLIEYYDRIGKTVLVTSFTNQALSNILDREIKKEKKIPIEHIIREGSKFGISSQYEYLSSQSQEEYQSIESYKKFFKSKTIWFVTISSLYIQHLPKKFDVVIIDEASQCLESNCLEALLRAEKFVLIGDERQLQPVVKSKRAIEKNMQISLFERLCSLYGEHKVTLKKQYRMSPAIMSLTNDLVYDGKLELGKEEMRERFLEIPENWESLAPEFLHKVIEPKKSLRFINYDSALNLFPTDELNTKKIKRLLQIKMACCVYKCFRDLGISRENILIISAYNSLVHQLVNALKKEELIDDNNSDVLTIDRSQGTDKEVIIFIFHQGNKQLIENYRRLNVALTRAKNKFIIVGSESELSSLATWTGKLAKLLIPDKIDIGRDFLEGLLEGESELKIKNLEE